MIVSPEIKQKIDDLWRATQNKMMAAHTAKNVAENNFTGLSQIDLDELTINFLTTAANHAPMLLVVLKRIVEYADKDQGRSVRHEDIDAARRLLGELGELP